MSVSIFAQYPAAPVSGGANQNVNIFDSSGNTLNSTGGALDVAVTSSALPTGGATAANQVTGNNSLASIDGKTPALGQALLAASVPVAIASNQTALPISAASLPLPTGAATESTLSTLNGKVTACNTGAVVVSSSALPTGAATSANQPGFGTAGTPSANVTSIQGVVSGTAVPVSVASAIPTKSPVNTNGSIVNTALSGTTASSAAAPGNAVGFILEAPSSNTDNIRWCIGGTASTTVGMLMEPGRDTGYVPCAATISICATVSGTDAYSIQWVLSS